MFLNTWVEITGIDAAGLQFAERSRLEDFGDSGCRFSLRGAIHRGSVVGIKPLGADGEFLPDEFPRLFLVIWTKCEGGRITAGARILRDDELSAGCIQASIAVSKYFEK